MRVFISGPMSKLEESESRKLFKTAETYLKSKGHRPVNPWDVFDILGEGLTNEEYQTVDNALLKLCDGIYMLDGWEDSNGAMKEYALAAKLKKYFLKR